MYHFEKATLEENGKFLAMYLNSLSSKVDDFLEGYILRSDIYSIYIQHVHSGYFGVFHDKMLTQFVLTLEEARHAQPIFDQILEEFNIKNALVPTCDEFFLSHSLDRHKRIEMQAYFFEDSKRPVKQAEYGKDFFFKATMDDLEEIENVTGDFLDRLGERIQEGQIYLLREKNELLGIGVLVDHTLMENCKSPGVFVNENHRRKGVGRSILLHLKELCWKEGAAPVPGCWYYNHESKRTLESAGFITKTRLLDVKF